MSLNRLVNIAGFTVIEDRDGLVLEPAVGIGRTELLELLALLPPEYELSFYDRFYPSMSDPGAYVSIERNGAGSYGYMMGNHGWSSDWLRQRPELLAAWMLLNVDRTGVSPSFERMTIKVRKSRR